MIENAKVVAYVDSLSAEARALLATRADIIQVAFPHPTTGAAFDALLQNTPNISALILGAQPVGIPQLAMLPRLAVVARVGVGYDMIDVPALSARRIPLMIAGVANSPSVAEQTFHLMLSLIKRGREHDRLVREGRWLHARVSEIPRDICGKTLLVVGFGRIGTRVVRRALAMEMNVAVFDPYVAPGAIVAAGASPVARLDEALPTADIVSLHCPRTPDTIGIIDARRLALFKRSALLINTARGGLVDEPALAAALRDGKIAGAGLDVLETEPATAEHPLFGLPNVLLSPHLAGVTQEALERMSLASVENVLSVFDGAPIAANVINHAVL